MKVLHILETLNSGGAENLVLDLCRNATSYDLDITILTSKGGSLFNEFKNSGVDIFQFQRRIPIDLRFILFLKKIVKKKGIQVIHTHQPVEAIHGYLATYFKPLVHIMNFHGYSPNKKNDIIRKFLLNKVDSNVVTSYSFLERLRTEGGFDTSNNFHVLYNGIDDKKLVKSLTDFRKTNNIAEEALLLGNVGNFRYVKDQFTICKALPKIFAAFPNSKFVFVGGPINQDTSYFNKCKYYCEQNNLYDKVIFLGEVLDLMPILDQLDLFVSASIKESFGIAVVEAMMKGIPCVISNIGPHLEISENGEKASIFKANDKDDLAEKVIDLLIDKQKRILLGNEGQLWASNNFTISNYIMKLKKLYSQLLLEHNIIV